MNPYYYDELPATVNEEEMMMVGMVVLIVVGVIALFALVFALLRSFSLYSIAKRRGISKAWLSWIPVGNAWILGSLADQYQHLALGQVKSRRKILLILQLISFVIGGISGVMSVLQTVAQINEAEMGAVAVASALPGLLNGGVGIASMVFYHMCNYDLYRSCDPRNAVAYLVLGIIIPVTEPFFYLANRKKDVGLPQAEPEQVVPVISESVFAEPAGPEL